MDYKPNLSHKQTRTKVRRALAVVKLFYKSRPTAVGLSKTLLDKHFGRTNDKLGKYLRSNLLVCVDDTWSWGATTHTKTYIKNIPGITKLMSDLVAWEQQTRPHITEDMISHEIVNEYIKRELPIDQLETGNFIYEAKSGRLHNPFQNIAKTERSKLLVEYGYEHDYDIDAAAPTLLLQLAQQLGFTKQTPHLDRLLTDKNWVRSHVQSILDIDAKTAKILINSLVNGAKVGVDNQFQKFAIYELLQRDEARVRVISGLDDIKADPFIKGLRSDISAMWSFISKTNRFGYRTSKSGRRLPMSCKQKAAIYRDIETQVMNQVSEYLSDKWLDIKHLRIHDGFVAATEIDEEEISDWVFMKTGYRINLTHKSLKEETVLADGSNEVVTTPSLVLLEQEVGGHLSHITYNSFSNNQEQEVGSHLSHITYNSFSKKQQHNQHKIE
jgi:hypothetical protein